MFLFFTLGSLLRQGRCERPLRVLINWLRNEGTRNAQRVFVAGCVVVTVQQAAADALAQDASQRYVFHIEEEVLGDALDEIVRITGAQLLTPHDLAGTTGIKPVVGRFSLEEALEILLEGSQLSSGLTKGGMIVISQTADTRPHSEEAEGTMNNQKSTLLASAALFLFGGQTEAVAQETRSALDVVVVTAQKREQGLAEVPISILALDGEQLERSGVNRVEDLYLVAPSISFSPAQSSSGAGLRVRGIGSAAFGSATEPSVSTVIDGVVAGPGGAALVDLFDVQRIEVLRGPQGTLFGKNASAGVVNIVSKAPTDEFEAYAIARYGFNLEELRVEGGVSGAIAPGLRARLSGYRLDQNEGQVWNPVRQEDENKRERFGVRFRTDYTFGDTKLDFIVQYEEQDNACCRTTFYGLQPTAFGLLTGAFLLPRQAANGVVPSPENRLSIADGPLREQTDTLQLTATIEHEFASGHQLRSITGYRKWNELDTIDVDGIDVNLANDPRQERHLRIATEEIQLLSPGEGALQYVVGLYLYDQNSNSDTITAGGEGTFLGQSSTQGLGTVNLNNYALFGDATYDIGQTLELFAGVRALYEKITVYNYRSGNFFAFPPGTFEGTISADDTNWAGRAGIRFTPSDNQSYYFSISRGYKGRAVDTNTGNVFFNNPELAVLEPETVRAFEFGARTRWFDNRLVFNATLFHSNFYDYQASSFDNVTSSQILRNAGELRSRGVEIDFIAAPWDGMTVNGGLAFVDAIFESYTGAPCTVPQRATGGCPSGFQDLSGQRLHNNPKWQYSLAAQQDFVLGSGVGAYMRGEWAWRDEVIYGGDLNPDTTQAAFGVANFRAGMTFLDGRYEIAGFVLNAFDKNYALRIYDSPAFTGSYSAFFGPARTLGVEVRAKF